MTTRRYKDLSDRLDQVDRVYNEREPNNEDYLLVKRKPRDDSSDANLFNSLLDKYSLFDSNTPKLFPTKKLRLKNSSKLIAPHEI